MSLCDPAVPPCPQLWVQERQALATSTDHGKDLPSVQLLLQKNEVAPRVPKCPPVSPVTPGLISRPPQTPPHP